MMKYIQGDLLTAEKGAIVHGCNSKGVMGSGVALAIREKWPEAYDAYRYTYEKRGLKLGSFSVYRPNQDLQIINMITQESYGRLGVKYVSYDAIDEGFDWLVKSNSMCMVDTINIPMIGSGLGGGNWDVIREIIDQHTSRLNVNVYYL